MLVGYPVAEPVDVLPNAVEFGVEEVDAVLGHPEAVLVDEIVAVAADVVALVDDQGLQAELLAAALGEDAPADAGADDDHVVLVREPVKPREPAGVVVVAPANTEVHARPLIVAEGGHLGLIASRCRS